MKHVSGNKRISRRVFIGKRERKRQTGRPRRRWEDIKMDLKETGRMNVGRISLSQYRMGDQLL
jgi:hypothetical protein